MPSGRKRIRGVRVGERAEAGGKVSERVLTVPPSIYCKSAVVPPAAHCACAMPGTVVLDTERATAPGVSTARSTPCAFSCRGWGGVVVGGGGVFKRAAAAPGPLSILKI